MMELEAFEVSKMVRPPYLLLSWFFLGFHLAWRVAFQHAISRVCLASCQLGVSVRSASLNGSLSHSPGRRTEQLAVSVGGLCQTSVKTADFEQAAFGQAKTCPQQTPGARHFGMATCSSHSLLKAQQALSEPYVHTQHSMHLKKPGQVFLEVL